VRTSDGTVLHYIYDGQNAVATLKEVPQTGGGIALMPVSTYLTGPMGPMCRTAYNDDGTTGATS
jgi:hypothetical protein